MKIQIPEFMQWLPHAAGPSNPEADDGNALLVANRAALAMVAFTEPEDINTALTDLRRTMKPVFDFDDFMRSLEEGGESAIDFVDQSTQTITEEIRIAQGLDRVIGISDKLKKPYTRVAAVAAFVVGSKLGLEAEYFVENTFAENGPLDEISGYTVFTVSGLTFYMAAAQTIPKRIQRRARRIYDRIPM